MNESALAARDARPSDTGIITATIIDQPPSTSVESRVNESTTSPLERFFNNFFREENIKWLSVIGAAIVLASSLMLVTHQWKNWSSEIKYITLLAYSVVAYVSASFAGRRLGLPTTSRVLELLTLLLIPVCYLALGWLHLNEAGMWSTIKMLGLAIPTTAFLVFASRNILTKLLDGPQPTFWFSYIGLSMSGALPTLQDSFSAAAFTIIAWAVMTMGVVKVNRHMFWLAEEGKQPRIFGFLPIALLGSIFVAVVSIKSARAIPTEWLGTTLVLVSTTILLTARSVAEVFRQRTGNLVRPLPWNLMVPMLIGLLTLSAGVLLSFYGFSYRGPTTIAVVPTTILAAVVLFVVAWDTSISGFAWPALVLTTVAYQSAPTLFSGLISHLKAHAAAAVNEPTLPMAFYGITYVPMIIAITLFAWMCRPRAYLQAAELDSTDVRLANRWRWSVFHRPAQAYATLLTALLLVIATFNLKAIGLVLVLDIALFAMMGVLFQDRRYLYAMLGCLVATSILAVPYMNSMNWTNLSMTHCLTSTTVLGLVLVSTSLCDRWLLRFPLPERNSARRDRSDPNQSIAICLCVGMVLIVCTTVAWVVSSFLSMPTLTWLAHVQLAMLAVVWFIMAWRTSSYTVALSLWMLLGVYAVLSLWTISFTFAGLAASGTYISCLVSILGYLLVQRLRRRTGVADLVEFRKSHSDSFYVEREGVHRHSRSVATLIVALSDLSTFIAVTLTCLVHLPLMLHANMFNTTWFMPLAASCALAWSIVMAILFRAQKLARIISACIPVWAVAMLTAFAPAYVDTVPKQALVWMCSAALVTIVGTLGMQARKFIEVNGETVEVIHATRRLWLDCVASSRVWIFALLLLSLFNADVLMRQMAIIGIVSIGWSMWPASKNLRWTSLAILLNVQAMLYVASLCGVAGWCFQWPTTAAHQPVMAYLLPTLAASICIFDTRRLPWHQSMAHAWSTCLRSACVVVMLILLAEPGMFTSGSVAVICGVLALTIIEWIEATRVQSEGRVWLGIGLLSYLLLWLISAGVLEFGVGISQVALAVVAAIGLLASQLLCEEGRFKIFARPMHIIGLVCPGVLTVMAVLRAVGSGSVVLDPIGTLTMFAAAAIYFHQSLIHNSRRYAFLALGTLNVAVMLMCRGLHLNDAQFYCVPLGLSLIGTVQLLKRDLPKNSHDPLRYAGALVMLVSPVFSIVDGSWIHMVTLLVLSVLVVLLSIGLRLRALLHTGTAFLLADLLMMVVRSTIDHPSLLWVCGLGLGAAVIVLAAICERHREQLLSRIRLLSAELATWN